MGQSSSKQLCGNDIKKYEQSLQFIVQKESPHFGSIKIYKMLEKPYDYLMRKTYNGLWNDPGIWAKYEWYRTMEEDKKSVAIDFMEMQQRQGPCGKSTELSIFCKYYYFTLEDAINKKIQRQQKFSQEEVLYILDSLLHLNKKFHRTTNEYFGLFKTSQIFISPEGFIKIYPFIKQWSGQINENQYQNISQNYRSSTKNTLENQCEISVNLSRQKDLIDRNQGIKTKKDDMRDIGIVLIQILTLARQLEYKDKDSQIKDNMIHFFIQKSGNKNIGIYRNMLKGLIMEDWCEDQADKELRRIVDYNNLRKTFCLKLMSQSDISERQGSDNEEIWAQLKKEKLDKIPKQNLIAGKIGRFGKISTVSQQSNVLGI